MPELPEVEVLVRSLKPLIQGKTIHAVQVYRPKLLAPTSTRELARRLKGARFLELTRRGKYLLFRLQAPHAPEPLRLLGHLGMTGRMYVQPQDMPLPKHAGVVLDLGRENFVFEDPRGFGRFTLDTAVIAKLGPEPLADEFTVDYFAQALKCSAQPVKVKLLDQSLVAGVGNIYASEALFRAGLSPRLSARRLKDTQVARLWQAIREVLAQAIEWGSTVQLHYRSIGGQQRLFYYELEEAAGDFSSERLQVYDHAGHPCPRCGAPIQRLVQAGRSTYFCPICQTAKRRG